MSKVQLSVNGKSFDGWKDVQIRTSLKACSGAFALSITDRWSGQREPWIVRPGDRCTVSIDGQRVITGHIDAVSPSFESKSRSIQVSGRDSTADLVDCSVDIGAFEFKDISIEELAKKICSQFGLPVVFNGQSSGRIERLTINPGETGFEVLDKYARQKGFLVTTNGLGSLLITRPGTQRASTALEQGKNIISGSAQFDFTERFSEYKVITQYGELAQELGMAAYSTAATATDSTVSRKRKLIIQSENSMSEFDARTRAQWEATVRAARSGKFKVTVQGWTQQNGQLWRVNQIVKIKSEWLGLNGDLLITGVDMSLSSDSGTTTVLELERKDAYLPEPEVKKSLDPLAQQVDKAINR